MLRGEFFLFLSPARLRVVTSCKKLKDAVGSSALLTDENPEMSVNALERKSLKLHILYLQVVLCSRHRVNVQLQLPKLDAVSLDDDVIGQLQLPDAL